jgi:hypothetical protein
MSASQEKPDRSGDDHGDHDHDRKPPPPPHHVPGPKEPPRPPKHREVG